MGEEGEPENSEGITKAAIHGRRAYEDYTKKSSDQCHNLRIVQLRSQDPPRSG